MACVCARRVLRNQRAVHCRRPQGAVARSGHVLIVGSPCGGGRAGERRGWDQERWLQALLLGARLLHSSISPACSILTVLEKGFSSPLAPLGFLLPCVILVIFPSRAAALLLTLSASPEAARCWSALVLPVPKPKPSPPVAARTWEPLPWNCLSSTPPSTLFCLKHFNVMGQQLRGCQDPFLEALSTFREEGRSSGLIMVSTLCHGLCVEAAGLTNLAEVSRARLCPALTLLPSTDRYN